MAERFYALVPSGPSGGSAGPAEAAAGIVRRGFAGLT